MSLRIVLTQGGALHLPERARTSFHQPSNTGGRSPSIYSRRKPSKDEIRSSGLGTHMSTLLVSSKGQIVLPGALRRRLGMGPGARIEVLEEADGQKLRVVRSVATADVTGIAGMVKAPVRGVPRRLEDFDPASLLTRSRRGKP
jgi:antitoxin PrlF